jgi:hypothetical protein
MAQDIIQEIASKPESQQLYADVCHIIEDTRTRVAIYVNSRKRHCLRSAETIQLDASQIDNVYI